MGFEQPEPFRAPLAQSAPVVRPDALGLQGPGRALSRSLEAQLIALCAREAPYRIEALPLERGAPDSLDALLEQTRGIVSPESESGCGAIREPRTGFLIGERVPVWSGASAGTIWSGPRVNYLFRAWHDSHHALLGAGFDPAGEHRAARYACSQVYGSAERAILWAEVWGQVAYFERWHAFPSAQRGFVVDAVRFGLELTVSRGLYHREEA